MGIRNVGLHFGPDVLLKYRPKHAALLATVSNAWAAVEMALTELLAYLVRCHYMKHSGESVSHDPLAYELWDSFYSIDQRFLVIRAAFRSRIKDDGLKLDLEAVLSDVRNSQKIRNRFVHAAYAVSSAYPKEIIMTKMRPFDAENEQPIRIKDLQNAIVKITESAGAVNAFRRRVEAAKDSTLPPAPPPPELTGETITMAVTLDTIQAVYDPPL